MNSAEMRGAEMTGRARRENGWIEAVKTVLEDRSSCPRTSLKQRVIEKNFKQFASGFFEEKSRGEIHKTKPTKIAGSNVDDTKVNRKDA